MTPENAETQSWVMKTVWQRIPGRRARNSKTPTTITVQTITRNDHEMCRYITLWNTIDWQNSDSLTQ